MSEQAAPRAAKSADRIDGAMMACGAILLDTVVMSESAQNVLVGASNHFGEMDILFSA